MSNFFMNKPDYFKTYCNCSFVVDRFCGMFVQIYKRRQKY